MPAQQQYGRGNSILSEIDSPTKDTPHRPTDDYSHCSSHSTVSIPLWTSDLTRLVVTLLIHLTIHYYMPNIILYTLLSADLFIRIFAAIDNGISFNSSTLNISLESSGDYILILYSNNLIREFVYLLCFSHVYDSIGLVQQNPQEQFFITLFMSIHIQS